MLNRLQEKIINAKGKSIVIAGAGSGKTHTMTELVKKLHWKDKIPLNAMWITTFTNKAANEIKERIQKSLKLKDEDVDKLWIGTFHSLASRYLRTIAKIRFGLLSDGEARTMVKLLLLEKKVNEKEAHRMASDLNSLFSIKRSLDCSWEEAEERFNFNRSIDDEDSDHGFDVDPEEIFSEYTETKRKVDQYDFDDLLEVFLEHIEKDEKFKKRFYWMINDESQDNNAIQQKIINVIGQKNVIQVGDIRQAIYEWRGATPKIFTGWAKSNEANSFQLVQNYRSSPEIINFVNEFIKIHPKFSKLENLTTTNKSSTLPEFNWTGVQQATSVAFNIGRQIKAGIPLDEIAVLSRSVKGPDIFALQALLTKYGIPYEVRGGFDLVNSTYAINYFTFLKGCFYPNKINTFNTLILFKGIKEKKAAGYLSAVMAGSNPSKNSAIDDYLKFTKIKNSKAKLTFLTQYFYDNMWSYKHSAEKESKKDILKFFVKVIKDYKSVASGIEALMLDANKKDDKKKRVVISTIHRSKGLEWKAVHLMNFIEGNMPSRNPISDDEEFCLAYVAFTRAKEDLKVYMPSFTPTFKVEHFPSSFIKFVHKQNPNCVKLRGISESELHDPEIYFEKQQKYKDQMSSEILGYNKDEDD